MDVSHVSPNCTDTENPRGRVISLTQRQVRLYNYLHKVTLKMCSYRPTLVLFSISDSHVAKNHFFGGWSLYATEIFHSCVIK